MQIYMMRTLNKRLQKDIENFKLNDLIQMLVYNIFPNEYKREYAIRRIQFEHWFDKKDKLIKDQICACSNNHDSTLIEWSKYGNQSPFKSYRDFLSEREDRNFRDFSNEISDLRMNTLGTYRRMRSPGLITINIDNMQIFFWSIICELSCKNRYTLTREKIEELARLCILKTLYHELFHHFTDVQSYITRKFRYDYFTEEALAVACSRHMVGFEAQNNTPFVSDFLNLAYSYTMPGYRDWVDYKSDEQFLLKLSEYIEIIDPLSQMGQEITPISESLLYAVFENPNTEFQIEFFD
jgi:hypothetical protein